MLSAQNDQGKEVQAEAVEWEDGPFYCPGCGEEVILKQGPIKIPHFAHYPESDCDHVGTGESDEHRAAKLEIYHALQARPDVRDVRLEHVLGEIRADVSFVRGRERVAIEVQASCLSRTAIAQWTEAYARKNIAVLWTPPRPVEMDEERYAPADYERYLHRMYYGQVFYWVQQLELVSVKFEKHMLAPNRYGVERYARRFVEPAGNLTLWLKSCEPHDRKSTESSNLVFLSLSHSAPQRHSSLVTLEIQWRSSSPNPTSRTGM